APRYPAQALRRGEQGTVMVRADIGPDGVPTSVSLVAGSGSRHLDRAAQDAVRRWRFTPATVDGRPTVGSVVVPIEFTRD
ncbi:MAG TPA: energy transducer TonB, partial [Lysobacter sp.]